MRLFHQFLDQAVNRPLEAKRDNGRLATRRHRQISWLRVSAEIIMDNCGHNGHYRELLKLKLV
jgi:hypothetical protein